MSDTPASDTLPSQQDKPEEKLAYRLITGPDNRDFCERISTALAEGYVLHGNPAAAFNAQAVVLPVAVATADAAVATAVVNLDADEDLNAEAFEGHA
jgi:hypothetical protein